MNVPDMPDQIDADLRSLPEQSTAPMRKVRRRWSATLRKKPSEGVVALAFDLFERLGYR
jgi:hypothetical protein